MTLVNAYEMSRLAMIFFDLRASYASCGANPPITSLIHVYARKRTHQQEGEDNTANEKPFADGEGNVDTAIFFGRRTAVKDLIRPGAGGQHGDRGEDIGHIDEEGFEDDGIKPEIPGQTVYVLDDDGGILGRDFGRGSRATVAQWLELSTYAGPLGCTSQNTKDVLHSHPKPIVLKLASVDKIELEVGEHPISIFRSHRAERTRRTLWSGTISRFQVGPEHILRRRWWW